MDNLRERLLKALEGQYDFERELGGGGMSRTYLVRERALDRRVVIKVLAPELLAGLSVERFRREVLLAAQLQHPHIVPVLTTGEFDGLPWFTMPYVAGDSLRQRLAKGMPSLSEGIGILRDVARALAFAHGHGVVHRDIKPDNVLLAEGSATVTDFGIAKAINAARIGGDGAPSLTATGTSIGSPAYMSPEQAAGDPATDHRADLYSFGAMAYEVITGHPPFHGLSPAKLLAAQMSERPKDIRLERPDCPEALAMLVMRCLEKEAGDRPQSAADLVRVLDTITSSEAGAAVPAILAGGRIRLARALSIWAVVTVGVAVTAWAAAEVVGLPEWAVSGAIGVMLAGLPVTLATWYVQRTVHRTFVATPQHTPGGTTKPAVPQGTMATLAIKASPHLSWRRTWLGGAVAVGGFAAAVVAFMVMRAAGIGPFGSLRGTGAFSASERLVVADFQSPPDDPTLGATVAEAIRTDLAQSRSLNVLSRADARDALVRMRRPVDDRLEFEVARELATREGTKAVLDGNIVQLGQRYVISARLVSALNGDELATFRETAKSEDDLLDALGRISKAVRERAGESLRSIRRSDDLARVTTASLPALRKYVEGLRFAEELGDTDRGLALLQEAVALDTAFAMAWRKISVVLGNEGRERARGLEALERAYQYRDRLTELERQLLEGYYFTRGPRPDYRRALAAYEVAARLDTTATAALNNAGVLAGELRQYQRAESLYREVVRRRPRNAASYVNLMIEQGRNRRTPESLDSTRRALLQAHPENDANWIADALVERSRFDLRAMDSITRNAAARLNSPRGQYRAGMELGYITAMRGRPREAMELLGRTRGRAMAAGAGPGEGLSAGLDSAIVLAFILERPAEGRAVLRRVLERYPPDRLPAVERPWGFIGFAAGVTGDPAIAQRALRGWEADARSFSIDAIGEAALMATHVAIAEQRWRDALASLREANQRLSVGEWDFNAFSARAFEALGETDSVRVAYQRLAQLGPEWSGSDAIYLASTARRLAEIADKDGRRADAIVQYERFVTLWQDAEPELQPIVRQARERLERLRANPGG